MDASFVSLVSSPVAAPAGAASAPPAVEGQGVRGADFANLLSQMMASAQRQGLAAGAPASLQAVALSPNIEVITADAPVPDNDSLLAFARSQGLDDGMIGALFVSPAGEPGAAAMAAAAMVPGQGAAALLAQSGQALQEASPGLTDSLGTLTSLASVAALPLPMNPGVLARGGSEASVLSGASALQTSHGVPSQPLALQGQGSAPTDPPTAASLAALGGTALRRLDLQWSTATPASAAGVPTEATAQVQAMVSAPALQNALRVRLQPQEAITRRLADLAASGQQAVWGELGASTSAEPDLLHLDLGELPLEALDERVAGGEGLATPQTGTAPAAARQGAFSSLHLSTPSQETGLPDRAAHYEQLAQRLGEALGQRLQAQIERGQWKVQMQVDPASLGRIDMELDMRAGGLDAVFRSDNAVTRELIAQGLPRLRETLAQSGTTVASVWVQGDGSRQSGGNPTPGHWAAPGRSNAGQAEEVSAEPTPVAVRPKSTHAWDLLA